MKSKIRPRLLFASSLITLTITAPAAFGDTISSSAGVRIFASNPNSNDTGFLALYNNGSNVQRTFLNFNLGSYSGKSITSDATLTLSAQTFGGALTFLTGVSLGTANSAWTQAGITWNNQPGLTAIASATNPDGNFGDGNVTWNIPWYMLEKMATTGSGYNNGLGITSGAGSTLHFQSSGPSPTLTFSAVTAASSTWTGSNGNWTDTANWAGSTVAEGIDQTATINGGTAVSITMDANRSVGALSFSGADHTISGGSGKLALNVTSGAPTVTVESGRIATIGATLVGIDGLTKSGLGTLTLTGANTYTGMTTVTAGTLQIDNGAANGVIGSGAYSVAGGAKMYLNNATAAALPWSQISGAGTLELNSAQAIDGSANWGSPALSNSFTGTLQVDKGRINGIPANLGGATNVALGDGAQFLAFDGSVNGTAYTFSQNFSLNGMGWGEGGQNFGAIRVSGLNATFSGNLMLNGNSGLYIQNAPNSSMNVTGVISDGGSGYGLAINAIGGTVTLSNQNTYTGGTSINAGTLRILNSTASGAYSIAGGAKMYLDSTTAAAPSWSQITGAGTLELNSAQAVNGSANWGAPALSNAFTGTLQLDKGRINGTPANLGGATAVVIGNGAQFLAYDGTTNGTAYTFTQNLSINGMGWGEGGQDLGAIRVSGLNATFSGNLNLTGNSGLYTQNSQNTSMNVTGVISDGGSGYGLAINAIGGTITLSNQNTYTGATSVNAGKLVVNGSISTSSLITVASGATLGGSGTVGALTISGNLAPGGGGVDINTLSAGTTTWNGGANLWDFDLGAVSGSADKLIINGDFTKGSGSVFMFDFMGSAPNAWGNTYTLASWTGATTFLASDFSFQNLGGSFSGPGSAFTISGNNLVFTAVPEPTSALAGLLAVAGLMRRRRSH